MDLDNSLFARDYLLQLLQDSGRKYKFKAKNKEEWANWQYELQDILAAVIGMPILAESMTDLPPEQAGEIINLPDYSRQKYIVPYLQGMAAETYLLRPPETNCNRAAVIALHGHGRGVDDVLGNAANEDEALHIRQHNYDYAVQLVKSGFTVIAPNLPGFGRSMRSSRQEWECNELQPLAIMGGITLLGMKLALISRLIDFAGMLPGTDAGRIGCLGLSGGGQVTLYAAALDRRIKAAVVSGYICQFKDSILAMGHCACNYVPGLYRLAENSDIASLIAPRPLFIESGDNDEIFPVASAELAVREIAAAYELHGVPENLRHRVFSGPHRYNGAGVVEFLLEALH